MLGPRNCQYRKDRFHKRHNLDWRVASRYESVLHLASTKAQSGAEMSAMVKAVRDGQIAE